MGVRFEEVFLEGHKALYDAQDPALLKDVVEQKAGEQSADLDWQRVAEALNDLKGIPVRI